MKIFLPLLLLIFCSCQKKNDYIIDDERAGLLKLGQTEKEAREILSQYEIKDFKDGVESSNKYFKVINNKKELMHLYFYRNKLAAIKIYDKSYKTKYGIAIGNTAQEIINSGLNFHLIYFGEQEGLRCEIKKKNMFGKELKYKNLQLYFSRSIYQNGASRYIGKNAMLKSFLLGKDFDIAYKTKTKEERERIKKEKRGVVVENCYENKHYGFKLNIPPNWGYVSTCAQTEDVINLFRLHNNLSDAFLSLSIQERTVASTGRNLLSMLGISKKNKVFTQNGNATIYQLYDLSKNKNEYRVYYATVINGNGLLFVGKNHTKYDLKETEAIIKELRFE